MFECFETTDTVGYSESFACLEIRIKVDCSLNFILQFKFDFICVFFVSFLINILVEYDFLDTLYCL